MNLKKTFVIFFFLFCFAAFVSAEETDIIERNNYTIHIKQYDKQYPVAAYIVYQNNIPLLDEIKKTLRKELIAMSKKQGAQNNVIASAWFDNNMTGKLEKIKLSKNYSSLVWVCGKERTIMPFNDYINYLKKKKKKEKEDSENIKK
ncbi:MAG: hypothetical protein AB7E39_04500 [Endomicrobiaceae bacterium]